MGEKIEKPIAESPKEPIPHGTTRKFFEAFRAQFQEDLKTAEAKNDIQEIRKIQEKEKELAAILEALDRGDVGPAQEKLVSMIEANVEGMGYRKELERNGVDVEKILQERGADPTRSYGQKIARLAGYLQNLELGDSPERKLDSTETSQEQAEVMELERMVAELNTSEASIRKMLNGIQYEKKRLEALLRQAALEKIKRSM